MTSLRNVRSPARALIFLSLTKILPDPVTYAIVLMMVTGMLIIFVALVRGGPIWERCVQVIRLLTRKNGGGRR